jgi:hypothetical protein
MNAPLECPIDVFLTHFFILASHFQNVNSRKWHSVLIYFIYVRLKVNFVVLWIITLCIWQAVGNVGKGLGAFIFRVEDGSCMFLKILKNLPDITAL